MIKKKRLEFFCGFFLLFFPSLQHEIDPKKRVVIMGMCLISVFENDTDAYHEKLLVTEREEMSVYVEETIVELQGEALKVLKGLDVMVGHLRKFLVDHIVLPLFEKSAEIGLTEDGRIGNLSQESEKENENAGPWIHFTGTHMKSLSRQMSSKSF